MWGGEWDMQRKSWWQWLVILLIFLIWKDGSLLISTIIPFEGADGEDSTALSVGEMITKIQSLRHTVNAERTAVAQQDNQPPILVPQCQHLWVVSGVGRLLVF